MIGWEALYRYKLQGTRINYRGEQLCLTAADALFRLELPVDTASAAFCVALCSASH